MGARAEQALGAGNLQGRVGVHFCPPLGTGLRPTPGWALCNLEGRAVYRDTGPDG